MGKDSQPYRCPFNRTEIRVDVIIRSQYSGNNHVAVSRSVQLKYDRLGLYWDCTRPAGFTDWTGNREDRILSEAQIIFHRFTPWQTVVKSLHFPAITSNP
jgi:hypothetical protein